MAHNDSAADILTRVSLSLDYNGDFPTQRKTLAALAEAYQNEQQSTGGVHAALLGDPIACIRALHRFSDLDDANHYCLSTYVQKHGVVPLLELEYSTITVSDYREIARNNPVFLDHLRKSIFSGLLASLLMREWGFECEEELMIAGSVLGCGDVLLSYYEPRLYRSAIERASKLKIALHESISQILGMPQIGLSISTAHALGLPVSLLELLDTTYSVLSGNEEILDQNSPEAFRAQALATSYRMAQLLSDSEIALPDENSIGIIANSAHISETQLQYCVEQLPATYAEFCRRCLLPSLGLPSKLDMLLSYATPTNTLRTNVSEKYAILPYVQIMQRMICAGGSAKSVLGCALETLVDALPFDRAILFLPDPECRRLYGSQLLGHPTAINPRLLAINLRGSQQNSMPAMSFLEGRIVIKGAAFLEDASLSVCLPVGLDSHTIGVIIADRVSRKQNARETLGDSVMKELRILTSTLHDCLLSLENAESGFSSLESSNL